MTRYVWQVVFVSATLVLPLSVNAQSISLKEIREDGVVLQKWDTSCATAVMAGVFAFVFNDAVTEHEVASGLLCQK